MLYNSGMEFENLPSHIPPVIRWKLVRWANMLSARYYGAPVYLVGSALAEANARPRDWDIRVELPDDEFQWVFGGSPKDWESEGRSGHWSPIRWRWSDECTKRTKEGWAHVGVNIDFQIYPRSYAEKLHRGEPKCRLDSRVDGDGPQPLS
jgi:hypothetical protein